MGNKVGIENASSSDEKKNVSSSGEMEKKLKNESFTKNLSYDRMDNNKVISDDVGIKALDVVVDRTMTRKVLARI